MDLPTGNLLYMYFVLLGGHFFADFVAQSHWMATNKSKSVFALSLHVTVYTSIMAVFFLLCCGEMFRPMIGVFVVITFFTHFITDFFTSKLTSWLWNRGDMHNFFVVIGFDQLLHQWTLLATLLYILAQLFSGVT